MNIWKYQENYKYKIDKKFQLQLPEVEMEIIQANLEELNKRNLALENLIFINELVNPTNSFKDRSLLYQISYYFQQKQDKSDLKLAISSSGNAAIAAANICKFHDLKLDIFVSDKLSLEKEEKLNTFKSENITIHQSSKAKSDCIKFCNSNHVINLRASDDDIAIEGYKSIAYEIAEQSIEFDSIFITCSSGTATLGIYQGLKDEFDKIGKILPQFHIIQIPTCNPIASNIINLTDKILNIEENTSLITCVVDKVAKRKDEITKLVLETSGSAWIVDNEDLTNSKMAFSEIINIEQTTWNSISSFAGMIRAKEKGWEFAKPLVIISGV